MQSGVVSTAATDGAAEVRMAYMWICSTCGEHHDDHFRHCWKCVGAETGLDSPAAPTIPKAAPEPKLRSVESITLRAGIAFIVGALLGVMTATRESASEPAAVATSAFVLGAVSALAVGLFVWVVFPYAPNTEPDSTQKDEGGKNAPAAPID